MPTGDRRCVSAFSRSVRSTGSGTFRRRSSAAAASSPARVVRRRRFELQLRRRAAAERVAERPPNHLVDVRLVAEAHLRLRRVDVHVDRRRRHRDEQVHLGTALLDRRDAVGIDDGVRDGAVLHDPPVDEHVLRAARRPLLRQRRDVAEHLDVAGIAPHLDEVVPLAVQLVQPVAQRADRRTLNDLPAGARQREPDLRITERELGDDARDLRRFGAVGLQELPAGGQVVEEIGDVDRRPLRHPHFGHRRDRRRR